MSAQNTSDVVPPAEEQHPAVEPPASVDSPEQVPPASDGSPVIKKPSEVNREDPNINVVDLPPESLTFKERVYGYARLIRGTMLGQPNIKEQGEQVLRGEQRIPLRRGSQSSK